MEYRIVRGILFVSPGKEIDHFRAERIIRYTESLLRQQRFRTMVFDLADTVFMDSAGVGMMIGLYREIRAWGGAVFIIRHRLLLLLRGGGAFQLLCLLFYAPQPREL